MKLLKVLPPEVCERVVFPFLEGKALSTLAAALFVDAKSTPEHRYLLQIILKVGIDRLEKVARQWQKRLMEEEEEEMNVKQRRESSTSILRAVHCIEQLQQTLQQERERENDSAVVLSRQISEIMIFSDLFYCYKTGQKREEVLMRAKNNDNIDLKSTSIGSTYSYEEWPVWCGRIQILLWVARGPFHGFNRSMLEANVMILSPNFNPLNFLAWHSVAANNINTNHDGDDKEDIATVGLVAETYNFLPTPPMGRLVGIAREDEESLQQIALKLGDQNTVAILSPQQQSAAPSRYMQNIRIVTRSQGRDRLHNMPALPFTSYVNERGRQYGYDNNATDDAKDLLCCWQFHDTYQDTILTTARDCVSYFLDILKNRERCKAR